MLKLVVGFKSDGLIRLLGRSSRNVDLRRQNPNLQKFLIFEGFIVDQMRSCKLVLCFIERN